MKKVVFFLSFLLGSLIINAQVPQGFNYQAIARDGTGKPIVGAIIKVKLSVLSDTTGFYATGGGTYIWEEEHLNVKTNAFGLFTVVFGDPTAKQTGGSATSFSSINWSATPLYIGTKIAYPTSYMNLGSAELWSVPYSILSSDLSGPLKKLDVTGVTDSPDSALFEVKNKDGQIIFAVYNDGVRIYVDDVTKGKGGFSIGGFGGSKAPSQDYLVVTPDTIRMYINDTGDKGKGGFAIGGFGTSKGASTQNLMIVSNDSIRMYIDDSSKGKGGFAIGGFGTSKGGNANYMNVATDAGGIINPSQNRILWYPLNNAFLTGRVLIEAPDSVGVNSFASGYESKAIGQYSQALGYKSIARGDYSTAIGKNSVVNGSNSYAFGEGVYVNGQNSYVLGKGSRAIGNGAYAFGENSVSSNPGSFALGTNCIVSGLSSLAAGYNATVTGNYSFSLGYSTNASGGASSAIGYQTSVSGPFALSIGYQSLASSYYAIAMGANDTASGVASLAIGWHNISSGSSSVSLGVQSIATAEGSVSAGRFNSATGEGSLALGNQSIASAHNGISIGNSSSSVALQSYSIGTETVTRGNLSTAIGYGIITKSFAQIAVGEFNDTSICYNVSDDDSRDPIFMVGNGIGSSSIRRNALTIFKNGNIGIGTINPSQLLDVNGNARFRGISSGTYVASLAITSNGTLTTATSDISMKKNIVPINLALQKVLEMNGVYFSWKNDKMNNRRVGFIAQDMEKILPEVVFTNPVDGLKGINYPELTAVLAQAVKEQEQKIENQQKEIDELKTLVHNFVDNKSSKGSN